MRALLLDSDFIQATILQRQLERLGCFCEIAANLHTAISLYESHNFNYIFLSTNSVDNMELPHIISCYSKTLPTLVCITDPDAPQVHTLPKTLSNTLSFQIPAPVSLEDLSMILGTDSFDEDLAEDRGAELSTLFAHFEHQNLLSLFETTTLIKLKKIRTFLQFDELNSAKRLLSELRTTAHTIGALPLAQAALDLEVGIKDRSRHEEFYNRVVEVQINTMKGMNPHLDQ